jgi:uncharacterized protein
MTLFIPLRGGVLVGWRGLLHFWIGVAIFLFVGAITLQVLGPPAPTAQVATKRAVPDAIPEPKVLKPVRPAAVPDNRPGRDTPGPIADPDPALLELAPGGTASDYVPRIAVDGRMPMQVYAAGFDRSSQRARVGLILAGIGPIDSESTKAIRDLPGGISLAISPYTAAPDRILSLARSHEHEYLLALPMEPLGFPNIDPGPQALMTNLPPAQNLERLTMLLARSGGYAGVTSALGGMRGERFLAMTEEIDPVLAALGERGLYWVDTRANQGALPHVWSRSVDLVIDEPADQTDIDAKLDQLSQMAKDRGAALGLATAPRPVTVDRIAAWTNSLMARGLVLAPVSALLRPPAKKDTTP